LAKRLRARYIAIVRARVNLPFARAVLEQARRIAARYQVVVRFDEEEGEFYGRGLEMPLAMGDGTTADQCVASTREAMAAVIATMIERAETPPAPAIEGNRSEQVNIRLTAQEKMLLEESARREGFRGLSDYVRAAALNPPATKRP
jgi:predicted RNase H-like HicB family nuclease